MELSELMQTLNSKNTIPKYMIWFGEEQKIIDMYIEHIGRFYNIVRINSVADAMNKIKVKSLDKTDKLYIVAEDIDYTKNEKVWDDVKATLTSSRHSMLLRYATINKTNKFYTRQKENITEFKHLQPEILTSYIQRDISLSDENCEKLCELCGNDYGRILLELDKIRNLQEMHSKDYFPNDAFSLLLKEGAIYSDIGDITFELTDAVLGGYPDIAMKKLDEAKRKGEPTLRIVSILYEGFRNLVSYQGLGKNKQDAGKRTGLTGWQIKKCIDLAGGYSIAELVRNMMLCQRIESGIKNGSIDEDIALELCILGCLR